MLLTLEVEDAFFTAQFMILVEEGGNRFRLVGEHAETPIHMSSSTVTISHQQKDVGGIHLCEWGAESGDWRAEN